MKIIVLSLLIALMSGNHDLTTYKLNQSNSELKVLGTSTMHDWEMTSEVMQGSLNATFSEDAVNIENLTLAVKAEGLKSGKSGMDKNAYKALKSDKHSHIRYKLNRIKDISKEASGKFKLIPEGQLSVAGNTRQVSIPVTATQSGSTITLEGNTSFKMSSFDIDPPSFMLGSVNTGDEVRVNFSLTYER